jgi:fumarate reductase flavoprotein subunit
VRERIEALALIHDGHRCHGAVVRDLVTGELTAYLAKATVIATGGYGRIWGVTTNALINEGMGAALALETGVARLGNMEAVQFHPTAIVPAGILVTEGCRGDGGLLKDADGHRFMPDYEPEKKELASRDVVSRRMAEHMRKGKGVQVRLRRAPVAGHHRARRRPHRQEPARSEGHLPVLPGHRPGED